jgi:poly(A) polymerase
MKKKTPRLDPRRASLRVVRKLHASGFEALWAGGCVRDQLLKRRPSDYDVATSARPGKIQKLFRRTIPVGKAFGVILVVEQGITVETATFRGEGAYRDGRRPSRIFFTSAQEDAKRRDFTINGLFYDPVARKLIDYVGGRTDLRKKIVRAIGNPELRFREDHLRLLRAVRVATVLNFKIEPKTWRAVRKLAPKIRRISAERIREELTKMFCSEHAARGLDLLRRSGLLKILLPEIEAMVGVKHSPDFHPEGDVWVHTALVMSKLPAERTPALSWAALLHDVGKPLTCEKKKVKGIWRWRFPGHAEAGERLSRKILKRLKWPRADTEAVAGMVANHMTFKDVRAMRLSTLKRLMSRPTFAEELELHRADCLGSHRMLANYRFLKKMQGKLTREQVRPKPLVNGHDLIEMGMAEGPQIGQWLRQVEEKQLEGELKTRGEALGWLRRNLGNSEPRTQKSE